MPDPKGKAALAPASETPKGAPASPTPQIELRPASGKVLAQYQIPLGANEAQLIFTGEELSPEDFEALHDYVDLFKKQFERKQQRIASAPQPTAVSMPDEMIVRDDEA